MSQTLDQLEIDNIITELHKRGFYDTTGMTYRELVTKLSVMSFDDIDVSADANKWF